MMLAEFLDRGLLVSKLAVSSFFVLAVLVTYTDEMEADDIVQTVAILFDRQLDQQLFVRIVEVRVVETFESETCKLNLNESSFSCFQFFV